ncbi:methyl-accepting chemotaxis protein [Marinitoga lauensis]|uniref:methyl-accepting chemotaxis protein n=1 Tax=Marinitoga lauensis TaxID=2201189 RepID=UPI0010118AC2|nr:methyl-accepting chemotaxis protein [Marinitoga lauensis]
MKSIFSKLILFSSIFIVLSALIGIFSFFGLNNITAISNNILNFYSYVHKLEKLNKDLLLESGNNPQIIKEYKNTYTTMIDLVKEKVPQETLKNLKGTYGKIIENIINNKHNGSITILFNELDNELENILFILKKNILKEQNITKIILSSLIAIVFIASIIIAILFSKNITKPVKILSKTLKDISDGNLNIKMDNIKSRDEIGQAANAIEKLREFLLEIITSISNASGETSAASEELSAASNEVSNNLNEATIIFDKINKETTENAASLEELTASIEEMAASADENSKSAMLLLKKVKHLLRLFKAIKMELNEP